MASPFTMLFRRSFTSKSVPEALWKLGRLNHIAIATPDLAKSASLYKNILGADISEPQHLPDHGVTTIFVNLGNTKLELLHPLGEKSPIQVVATTAFCLLMLNVKDICFITGISRQKQIWRSSPYLH